MKTNPNDTAFAYGTDNYDHKGLTKREHFAGLAMQGILSGCHSSKSLLMSIFEDSENKKMEAQNYISGMAIEYADALIAELNRTQD